MLVLQRKPDETIVIETRHGERITVMVVDMRPHSVRLGIVADESVSIQRGEIQLKIDEQRKDVPLEYLEGMAIEIRSRQEDQWLIVGHDTYKARYAYLNRSGQWQPKVSSECMWNTEEAARSFVQAAKEAAL